MLTATISLSRTAHRRALASHTDIPASVLRDHRHGHGHAAHCVLLLLYKISQRRLHMIAPLARAGCSQAARNSASVATRDSRASAMQLHRTAPNHTDRRRSTGRPPTWLNKQDGPARWVSRTFPFFFVLQVSINTATPGPVVLSHPSVPLPPSASDYVSVARTSSSGRGRSSVFVRKILHNDICTVCSQALEDSALPLGTPTADRRATQIANIFC